MADPRNVARTLFRSYKSSAPRRSSTQSKPRPEKPSEFILPGLVDSESVHPVVKEKPLLKRSHHRVFYSRADNASATSALARWAKLLTVARELVVKQYTIH